MNLTRKKRQPKIFKVDLTTVEGAPNLCLYHLYHPIPSFSKRQQPWGLGQMASKRCFLVPFRRSKENESGTKNFNKDLAVAEGVKTSLAVHLLAEKLGVEMPICASVYEVIHKGSLASTPWGGCTATSKSKLRFGFKLISTVAA